jgi:acetyltransferase
MPQNDYIGIGQFFYPKSLAIIGFSLREGNQGQSIFINLNSYGFQSPIYLVGRSGGQYLEHQIYATVEELPECVDLAVIVTGARSVPEALDSCGQRGIKYACIASGGFDEFSPGGSPFTVQLREVARKWNIHFTGPNGFGVVNLQEGVFTAFGNMAPEWMRSGRVSVISQSGGLLYHIGIVLTTGGMGVAKGVSMGNKVNLNETDFLPYLLQDDGTDIIWLYLESFSAGRTLLEQARSAVKPILLLKSGRTLASQHVLKSHTAAMVSDDRVVSAMARQANIVRVSDFRQMVEVTKAFSAPPVRGNDLLVFARSGGTAVMAVDEAEANGFHLVDIPEWFADEFRMCCGPNVITPSNPVDLGTIFNTDTWLHLLEIACHRMKVDAIILSYISSPIWSESVAPHLTQAIKELASNLPIPLVLVVAEEGGEAAALERDLGIPVYREIGDAIQSLATVRDWWRRKIKLSPSVFNPVLPARTSAMSRPSPLLHEALELIEMHGIQVAPWAMVHDTSEAVTSARRIGFPLALKVISAEISHKTDLGGVILDIPDEPTLIKAWETIQTHLGEKAPGVQVEQFLLQKMASGGKEMIIGAKRDPTFGPIVLLGLGGIYAEVFNDISLRVAPLDRVDAEEMISELKSGRLLRGVRGETPVNIDALCQSLLAVSKLMLEHPEIEELDINPILVTPEGILALDVRIGM